MPGLFFYAIKPVGYHLLCLVLLACSLQAAPAYSDHSATPTESTPNSPYIVLMINQPDNPFWRLTEQAAIAAAQDLGIRLKVVTIDNNPLRPTRILSALVNSNHKPDAVLFPNIKASGKAVLNLLERHRIYGMVYSSGFSAKESMGAPGEHYRYWVGEITATDYAASRQLTRELIEHAFQHFRTSDKPQPLSMIVLEGSTASQTNSQRLLGMFDALIGYKERVQLKQIFRTRYDPEHAYSAILAAKKRYPGMRIIWVANDAMTLSVVDAVRTLGLEPGKDILISSFDRTPEATALIEQGALYNSYGGNYMAAAWGLVYLNDLLKNNQTKYQSFSLPLFSALETVDDPLLRLLLSYRFTDIDFNALSYRRDKDGYPFTTTGRSPISPSGLR